MSSVTLKNIKKIYPGNVTAVKKFDIEIQDKEFIVLVGPSGCGKTTVLRMIAGLEEISEGELYIDEKKVNEVHPKERDIAMVFQNYALYPHMTIFENMAFGLKLRKFPKKIIEEKVKEVAKILEIDHLLDRYPKALSGGQRQRVALGRAIVREPRVFLMDEPLSNLDAKLRVHMRTEISRLHQRLNTTFIYVTHDQTEAMTMATRIVLMNEGEIQQIDTPKRMYDHPKNIFVARFIGSPQMNIFEGTVKKDKKDFYILLNDNTRLEITDEKKIIFEKENYENKKVYLGIRPENLHETSVDTLTDKYSSLNLKINVIEMMGAETLLYMNMMGNEIIARVDPKTEKKVGDMVELRVHWNRIHIFDYDNEKNIMSTI
ncbi:ABC transporter ATP-binding protein [Fusobacterium necrophorum]|uniref:Sugar ABC transporter ATP-binding protein n=1 Tax=Fusobacterium necrophorum DJ-2 TaxID=1441737 RepID=A0AB73C0X1_9FUSO|nr:sn-glycerol-3-phosphate ABC transporter ATP-binding protein UgpC [Fusobacterium necrophorum]KDE63614.1 sugar ABC transporter ATP-binding protein [Fusobacterium necrophorum BFTR-1]KDE65545.1 sugar ABC transporter ATP-binding protein [Fusobacterium necrophorum DJ-1]KDE70048.1 sugar ABC transporter ATP-binding protein [Fusobacterium necrophorum DJ-2]MBR8822118.1 Oligosaccharides import ATP-binding protein MsmX [Fusobacterium necrophorum]